MLCKLTSNIKLITTKKADASNLKEADYLDKLHLKADHQGSKIPFTEFWWIGPYIIEMLLPNNNYLILKIGTNKTQVLHRMRMRQFTPLQSPHHIRTTPQEWKPDPEVSLKHDDLYARAWECEYEKQNFDAEINDAAPPKQSEIPIKSGLPIGETQNARRTT